MSDNKNTICAFPWHWYSIDTGFGWWRSCPRAEYKKLEDLNFNNHDSLIEQRKNLRAGVEDNTCKLCWESQRVGAKSYRQVLGQDHVPKNVEQDIVPVPRTIEIKFANLCNLKCVFCSSNCSSLWEIDDPVHPSRLGTHRGPEVAKKILDFCDTNYANIDTFQLFGGEPVLHKEFGDLFDLILSKPDSDGQKEISFSTNMYYNETYRQTFENRIQSVLDRGHKLFMRFSIDGVGEQGEYLRTGMQWQKFEDNLKSFMDRFHDHPNIGRTKCNIALNITNIVYLDTIMEYLHKLGYSNVQPHYNYVGKPKHFYVQSYGTRLNSAIDIIKQQNYYGYDSYKTHVIDLLDSMKHIDPDLQEIEKGKNWLDKYDLTVNKQFLKVFPLNEYMYD